MDNRMPMRVFGIDGDDTITEAIRGAEVGTTVRP
jgi:uridylate kinase